MEIPGTSIPTEEAFDIMQNNVVRLIEQDVQDPLAAAIGDWLHLLEFKWKPEAKVASSTDAPIAVGHPFRQKGRQGGEHYLPNDDRAGQVSSPSRFLTAPALQWQHVCLTPL